MTMKQNLLCGATVAHVSCLAFLVLGLSQIVRAQPTSTSPDYSISVFATAPNNFTGPDSIAKFQNTIWVGYQNKTLPTGGGGDSDIVQFSTSGTVLNVYAVKGRNDGLKFNPYDGMIYALQNEDGNPYLALIDPVTNFHAPMISTGGPPVEYDMGFWFA